MERPQGIEKEGGQGRSQPQDLLRGEAAGAPCFQPVRHKPTYSQGMNRNNAKGGTIRAIHPCPTTGAGPEARKRSTRTSARQGEGASTCYLEKDGIE